MAKVRRPGSRPVGMRANAMEYFFLWTWCPQNRLYDELPCCGNGGRALGYLGMAWFDGWTRMSHEGRVVAMSAHWVG